MQHKMAFLWVLSSNSVTKLDIISQAKFNHYTSFDQLSSLYLSVSNKMASREMKNVRAKQTFWSELEQGNIYKKKH